MKLQTPTPVFPAADAAPLAKVPRELKDKAHWVVGRAKVPFNPRTGGHAKANDPATWATFDEALAARARYESCAFALTKDTEITGYDLDHCRDKDTGKAEPWAAQIIAYINSYTEVSPSGEGIRIFARGTLPPGDRKIGDFENYDDKKFLTVTGDHLTGTPTKIEDRQPQIDILHHWIFASRNGSPSRNGATPTRAPVGLPDDDVIYQARAAKNGEKFQKLWSGDWSADYPSQSEADLALMGRLKFWTGNSPDQLDRLYRRSGLQRKKWDERHGERTYGEGVIAKALESLNDQYEPTPDLPDTMTNVTPAVTTNWPEPPAEEAFHGLAGDVVRAIEPYSEADPAALLLTFLTHFGAKVGAEAHYLVEGDKHPARLFITLVGPTAGGRKGTSWGRVQQQFEYVQAVPDYHDLVDSSPVPIRSGLSSGEGVIHAVRDAVVKRKRVKKEQTGKYDKSTGLLLPPDYGYEDKETDEGVEDKRVLVYESEFGRILRVMRRESNPLSAILRQAWDSGNLGVLNKNEPYKATGSHICIVGHITKEELLRHFDNEEAANGFGNRFLWIAVKRSKLLPEGGEVPPAMTAKLAEKILVALRFAGDVKRVNRDADAKRIWAEVYPRLASERPGLYGAVTARGDAQVTRLSLIYALLDSSPEVRPQHLRAALAVWDYAERSARWIWGDKLGDPDADKILTALRQRGELTQSQIYVDVFDSHAKAERIDAALAVLLDAGLAISERRNSGGGRPLVAWRAK